MLHRVFVSVCSDTGGICGFRGIVAADIFGQTEAGKFDRLPVAGNDVRLVAVLFYVLHQPGKVVIEMLFGIRGKRIHGHVAVDGGAVADFVSDEGADTGKGGVERLCDRKRLFHGAAKKSLLRDLQRIQTVILRCGNAVGASRQNFTQRTHRSRYVFDAVDDSAVRIAENDIAPLAHQLHDQGFLTQVAHLVQVLDLEVDDALHVRLADLHDPSVCDMLAQKHAEIRRGERTRFVGAGQI